MPTTPPAKKAMGKGMQKADITKKGYVPSGRQPVHFKGGKMYDTGSVNTAHVLWSRFPHQTDRQSKTDKKLSWDLLLFDPDLAQIWDKAS